MVSRAGKRFRTERNISTLNLFSAAMPNVQTLKLFAAHCRALAVAAPTLSAEDGYNDLALEYECEAETAATDCSGSNNPAEASLN